MSLTIAYLQNKGPSSIILWLLLLENMKTLQSFTREYILMIHFKVAQCYYPVGILGEL